MIFENFTVMDYIASWGALTGSIAIYIKARRYFKEKSTKEKSTLEIHYIPKGELRSGGNIFVKKDDGNFMNFTITNIGKDKK